MKQSCASCKHALFKGNDHYGQCTIHWCLDGSAHPMISKDWTCGSDCKDYYCYEKLAAILTAHAAEVERLQNVNAQLVKTLDIREAALRDLLNAMESNDPIQSANCRVLEYHQLKEEVANMKAERDNSKSDKNNEIVVWDLDNMMWESIKKAASESNWIPEEYLMNDWVYDVCGWLRDHPEDAKTDTSEVERLTGERDAAVRERDAAVEAIKVMLRRHGCVEKCCAQARAALAEMEQKP